MTETTRKIKHKRRRFLKTLFWFVFALVVLTCIIAMVNAVSIQSNSKFIEENIEEVVYTNKLLPEIGDDENFTFTTDDDFKIMQLTDIHLGGGCLSVKKDNMALNAVAAMINEEKPDLVIVTGDIAFPVPYASGTFNNRHSAILFAQLMEKLGVYWCMSFGNHDTEVYSYYSRRGISNIYENREKYPHCLFQFGSEDVSGCGNYIINIKNTAGKTVQSLFMFDSHSYTDGDLLGILWKYDCIHTDQVLWYEKSVKALTENNGGERPNSLAFFHIPPSEMNDAFEEYQNAGNKDTANVKYNYGKIGEGDYLICSSQYNYGIFEAFQENGTQGAFFGHDHLNNLCVDYKGVRLTYGYSIDYLAYSGISKYGLQRGCTIITVHPDGSFDNHAENYYQDKYRPVFKKEAVDLEHDLASVEGTEQSPLKKSE